MLRRPSELSDGQRYRLRLAQLMQQGEGAPAHTPDGAGSTSDPAISAKQRAASPRAIVLADEFGATLDRQTASALARNIRKWTTRSKTCFIAATTHDALLEPLMPDVLVETHGPGEVEVLTRDAAARSGEEHAQDGNRQEAAMNGD
jgi:ABC-type ATPase with predicted acetyltransferase domain